MPAEPIEAETAPTSAPLPLSWRLRVRGWAASLRQLVLGWDVFISYSRSDGGAYARNLRKALSQRGVSAFLDDRDLNLGDELAPRLRRAAQLCSLFAPLITAGATAHPRWVRLEAEAAATSWLRPVCVPVAFPPARGGDLGPAHAALDALLALDDTRENLAAGTPAEALVTALCARLDRRRLRQRRWIAASAIVAMVAAGGLYQRHRTRLAERELQVQRWVARAETAATAGRYDLAEYAMARAIEIDRARKHLDAYARYRARRALEPAGPISLVGSTPDAADDSTPISASENATSAGRCTGLPAATWQAVVHDQAVQITRTDRDAVRTIDVPGLAIATVHASPDCERYFVQYGRTTYDDPLQPPGTTTPGWVMAEWNPTAPPRTLPSDLVEVAPASMGAGSYGLARTSSGQLIRLPLTDAVVMRLEPEVLATGVTDLTAWPDSSATRGRWTLSLETDLVVVRDDGAMVTRVPARVDEPTRVRTSGDAVIVEGATHVSRFTRAAPPTTATIPPARDVAAALGLSADEARAPF